MIEIIRDVGTYAGTVALIGFLCLVPLAASQYRDLRRLSSWHEREPERGDAAAPIGPMGVDPSTVGRVSTVHSPGVTAAAARVTLERPAIQRTTTEEELPAGVFKLKRPLSERMPVPSHPLAIAAASFLVGAGIFLGTLAILTNGGTGVSSSEPRGPIVPAEVEVAVLNGTGLPGVSAEIAEDVTGKGFTLGSTAAAEERNKTVILFTPGDRRAAVAVQKELKLSKAKLSSVSAELGPAAQLPVDDAQVIIIAGRDQAFQ